MEFTAKVYTRNSMNPRFIHTVKVSNPSGDVVADAIVWTDKPDSNYPSGHSQIVKFDAKIAEHAAAIHTALARELKGLGLEDEHVIANELTSQRLARIRHHFDKFDIQTLGGNRRRLNIKLSNYVQGYLPIERQVKPKAVTSVEKPVKAQKVAKAPTSLITIPAKEVENNKVSIGIQNKTNEIEATKQFLKRLVTNKRKRDAQNIVAAHVFSSIPGSLVRYSSIISNANNLIDTDGFEGMARKLDQLPKEHAHELVKHVVNKTLEITNALELLRTYNIIMKLSENEATAMNALNREAIRLNHALNISFLLTKHQKKTS